MSCILRLFGFQRPPTRKPQDSQRFSVNISLEGPLPERDYELRILEEELVKRISATKKKSYLALKNACYYQQKGDMRRYVHHMNEKKNFTEEIQKISKRLMDVLEKRNDLSNPPPLELPPPKIENTVANPVWQLQNVPNHPSPPLVSTRPVGRSRSYLANTLPPAAANLHRRT